MNKEGPGSEWEQKEGSGGKNITPGKGNIKVSKCGEKEGVMFLEVKDYYCIFFLEKKCIKCFCKGRQ